MELDKQIRLQLLGSDATTRSAFRPQSVREMEEAPP